MPRWKMTETIIVIYQKEMEKTTRESTIGNNRNIKVLMYLADPGHVPVLVLHMK